MVFKKLILILLCIAILSSYFPKTVLADTDSTPTVNTDILKEFTDNAINNMKFENMYVTDGEGEEKIRTKSENLATFPSTGFTLGSSGVVESNGRLVYYDEASGKTYDLTIQVDVGDESNSETIYYGNKTVKTSENETYLHLKSPEVDDEDPLSAYSGKTVKMTVKMYDDEGKEITTFTQSKEITSSDIEAPRDITKEEGWLEKILGAILAPISTALRILEEVITGLLLSFGDGVLILISSAVGQKVTLDKIIYGNINKVSIDFWGGDQGAIAATMAPAIDGWYKVFFTIAASIYLLLLLVIGLQILFSSTAGGKAKYQVLLKDWLVGVAILCLFPYAMKLMSEANTSIVKTLGESVQSLEDDGKYNVDKEVSIVSALGGNLFVKEWVEGGTYPPNKNQGMIYIRYLAGKQARIPLAIVYLIMVFQLIVILFVYYKRAFMVAFLITIFPLTAVAYTLDKLGNGVTKTRAFSNWLKEFMLNVFMQTFHAVTYTVVIQAGVASFIGNGNWFFLVICTIFLFEGERIIRKIFNMDGGAGTIKDIGTVGMAAYAMAQSALKKPKGKKKSDDDKDDNEEDDESDDEVTSESGSGTPTTPVPGSPLGARGGSSRVTSVRPELSGLSKARQVITEKANTVRDSRARRVFTTAVGMVGGASGAIIGATYHLATGQSEKAFASGLAGWAVGKGMAKTLVATPIKGITNAFAGKRYKKKVMRGDFDKEFKKAGLDIEALETANPDTDWIESKTADMIRKALADQMSAAVRRGEEVGNYKFYKSIDKSKKSEE